MSKLPKVELEITPEQIRSLILSLDPMTQFALLRAILNQKTRTRYEGFSLSDIRLLRGFLQSTLIET